MQLSPLQSRLAASVIASCLLLVIYLILLSPKFAFALEFDPISPEHDVHELSYEQLDAVEISEALDLGSPAYEPKFALFDRSIIGRVEGGAVDIANNEVKKSNLAPGSTMTYVFQVSSVNGETTRDLSEPLELRRSLNTSRTPVMDGAGDKGEGEGDGDGDGTSLKPELVRRKESTKTLWISANTCLQPARRSSDRTAPDPPQLTLYVSTSPDNTSPGPEQSEDTQKAIVFTEGAVMFNTSIDKDVYLSISAPSVSAEDFDTSRQYNFELVASTDRYYYTFQGNHTDPGLVWVDSDASAALLQTNYLNKVSSQVIKTPPYVMFAHNDGNIDIRGVRNSYCGLSSYAQIRNLADGSSGMMTIGLKNGGDLNLTRQEFYVSGLNTSSNYTAILARPPGKSLQTRQDDSSDIGGGIVFQPASFSTKPNGACTFIFNLTFCDQTQYAVPGNPQTFPNATALGKFYDDYVSSMWDNFDKVLQQTPCEAPSTARYSLARDCDDCKAAYKRWLCSVAIPRCEDFSSPDRPYLQMRNIGTPFPNGTTVDQAILDEYGSSKAFLASRNPKIDEVVKPGPYKELLPCDNLCYELVQSCPASMGFKCPLPQSKFSFKTSYASKSPDNSLSCNYPGSAHFLGGAGILSPSWTGLVGVTGALLITLL
ncbi:stretch-activated Ca2+-permeable channel component-domain-containing protein [Daldinia caldariorum]|uniref:stretch-activated Ca2+-permeable channel component-domain-containing protein n=1 Tax=Daldinia caldariorum TaxID=326644 RepID=UPI002007F5C9|nr:stretch-activated Ca2+-permeable channel component-domain-containing protein [Daldinia caldariorum]KAI1468448.1 stretch-activated Ca2+-permeable channel component-domain-containing protein [Daldinia caldariorum]